ncbi:DNA/RNA helicase [Bacillus mycoides]|uniref:UvrD-helicase domain-containing protein n=1 Tax=Bacillus mycoides TaxID=1405 RepID=UPI001C02D678|nr:UvrD-helicase domain-containing protein [Bacillus mycoides]QWG26942.1 DNA/RNA helicase [Bacillus mycoides]
MNYTEEQFKAINSSENFILVKAGAGTGKTEVLARRILRLLEEEKDLSIRDMAIITFTNKATENLKTRLKDYMYLQWKNSSGIIKEKLRYEIESLNTADICTIHKFCKNILDDVGPVWIEGVSYSPEFSMSFSINQVIQEAVEEWVQKAVSENKVLQHSKFLPIFLIEKYVKQIYKTIKSQGIDIQKVLKLTEKQILFEKNSISRNFKRELIGLLNEITLKHKKYKNRELDADDLLEYCYKVLLSDTETVEAIRQRYKYIFVDEFQDTSLYQTGIIQALCDNGRESPKLFLVGDLKQSIYKFRGADLQSYKTVEDWIKKYGVILPLNTNFRSKKEIILYVNWVFENIAKDFKDISFKPEPLKIKDSAQKQIVDLKEAYEWMYTTKKENNTKVVGDYIKEQHEKGIPLKKFAILFRRNDPMLQYGRELSTLKIPHKIIGAGNFYNQREIIDMWQVTKWLMDPSSKIKEEAAYHTIYFVNEKEQANLLELVRNELEKNELTPAQLLDFIYVRTKIRERIKQDSHQASANLNKLKELVREQNRKENMSMSTFIGWLGNKIISNDDEPQADIPIDNEEEYVTLITIHKAKGLEYPIVILPDLHEKYSKGILNPPVIINEETGLEFRYQKYYDPAKKEIISDQYYASISEYEKDLYSEELRILYVALTRAKEKVILVGKRDIDTNQQCFQNWLREIH